MCRVCNANSLNEICVSCIRVGWTKNGKQFNGTPLPKKKLICECDTSIEEHIDCPACNIRRVQNCKTHFRQPGIWDQHSEFCKTSFV